MTVTPTHSKECEAQHGDFAMVIEVFLECCDTQKLLLQFLVRELYGDVTAVRHNVVLHQRAGLIV